MEYDRRFMFTLLCTSSPEIEGVEFVSSLVAAPGFRNK